MRRRHKEKVIEAALAHAEVKGWRVEPASGHAWGRMYCPFNDAECRCGEFCIVSIWSTPRNAANHVGKACTNAMPLWPAEPPVIKA